MLQIYIEIKVEILRISQKGLPENSKKSIFSYIFPDLLSKEIQYVIII